MIICHPLKLIFIKTKKVGGTSFEIALSKFCSNACIITPLLEADERTRMLLGHRGPQNYDRPRWPFHNATSAVKFTDHAPAAVVRATIPPEIWSGYTKVAIYRNSYDYAISQYYFDNHFGNDVDFGTYIREKGHFLTYNTGIAPLSGPDRLDVYLRYERLEEEMAAVGLGDVYNVFRRIRAKGRFRPRHGADVATMYRAFPDAAKRVAELCAEEIARFGYTLPDTRN